MYYHSPYIFFLFVKLILVLFLKFTLFTPSYPISSSLFITPRHPAINRTEWMNEWKRFEYVCFLPPCCQSKDFRGLKRQTRHVFSLWAAMNLDWGTACTFRRFSVRDAVFVSSITDWYWHAANLSVCSHDERSVCASFIDWLIDSLIHIEPPAPVPKNLLDWNCRSDIWSCAVFRGNLSYLWRLLKRRYANLKAWSLVHVLRSWLSPEANYWNPDRCVLSNIIIITTVMKCIVIFFD